MPTLRKKILEVLLENLPLVNTSVLVSGKKRFQDEKT
jgi:hypothetical protein